jgi:hypothetical protein
MNPGLLDGKSKLHFLGDPRNAGCKGMINFLASRGKMPLDSFSIKKWTSQHFPC